MMIEAAGARGDVVGREVPYSDRLLLVLARRVDPVAWGDRPDLVARPEAKQTAEAALKPVVVAAIGEARLPAARSAAAADGSWNSSMSGTGSA